MIVMFPNGKPVVNDYRCANTINEQSDKINASCISFLCNKSHSDSISNFSITNKCPQKVASAEATLIYILWLGSVTKK